MLGFNSLNSSVKFTTVGSFGKPTCTCDQGRAVDQQLGIPSGQLRLTNKTSSIANAKFNQVLSLQKQTTCPAHRTQGKS